MNMSQATDEYLGTTAEGRQAIANAAIRQVPCTFCEAEARQACSLRMPYDKGLDGFCHTGRWMKYLIERNSLDDLFGPSSNAKVASDDLSDLIG